MSWAALFERAVGSGDVSVADVREALARRRERGAEGPNSNETPKSDDGSETDATRDATASADIDPAPTRVVADADVLAADLLVGGPARDALDAVRAHSWMILVASDDLLDDAAAVVAELAGDELTTDWRARVEQWRDPVSHPPGDHPALASAYRGGAMHLLSFDEGLRSAGAGVAIRARAETSVKHPRAFARLFDPESLYAAVEAGEYPGPDRDPRG